MLILTRRVGETLMVGNDVTVGETFCALAILLRAESR
jgi:hypothetical protein